MLVCMANSSASLFWRNPVIQKVFHPLLNWTELFQHCDALNCKKCKMFILLVCFSCYFVMSSARMADLWLGYDICQVAITMVGYYATSTYLYKINTHGIYVVFKARKHQMPIPLSGLNQQWNRLHFKWNLFQNNINLKKCFVYIVQAYSSHKVWEWD